MASIYGFYKFITTSVLGIQYYLQSFLMFSFFLFMDSDKIEFLELLLCQFILAVYGV